MSGAPRIAVLGGGPAGLGAAYALASAGLPVTLHERAPQVGGLARSFALWGQTVELGAHLLLREDPHIDRLWTELLGDAYDRVPRQTRILADGRWLRYPYEPLDLVRGLGLRGSLRCAGGALGRRRSDAAGGTLEAWIVERFGRPAFELLAADYVEKLFGRPARELDAALAGSLLGFQRRPTLASTLGRAVRRNREPALVRPHGGVGELARKLADAIVARGGRIACESDVGRLEIRAQRVCGIELDGRLEPVDHVISTIPLPALAERLTDVPAELAQRLRSLPARSAVIAYVLLDGPPPFAGQWVYLADPGSPVSRITSFSGWTPAGTAPPPQSILAFELWCEAGDATWELAPDALRAIAQRALADVSPAHATVLDVAVRRGRDVLPVLSPAARATVAEADAWFGRIEGLRTTGRHGAFANTGVHESLLLGVEAGRALASA
ncbi:MAG TPA: FAD-dependent oxidoreductase [Conexibacter sp.]|nr:FAD-dependent oxidoreductase [Conexibacter sp.]